MSATRIDEIGNRIYRIHTPVREIPGGFSFNQFLVDDDEPLLMHTGGRALFDGVSGAIQKIIPMSKLRWICLSHFESDECGALNQLLAAAAHAIPVCSNVAAMTSIRDMADRPPRVLADGETLKTGTRQFTWFDAPHVPHAWENGFLHENTTRTLLCGDLFTQPGADAPALTTGDILGPSEALRSKLEYYAHAPNTRAALTKLADLKPQMLACMHGSAWQGDGASLLLALADALEAPRR